MRCRSLSLLILMMCPSAALAELEVCNETSVSHAIAIGYKDSGDWVSEGWWNIAANTCKTVVGGDLDKRYYYLHPSADGLDYTLPDFYFCTQPSEFTIRGDADCEARGFTRTAFLEVKLEEGTTSYTHSFGEYEPPEEAKPDLTTTLQGSPDPAGTHGEPFSVFGTFNGCGVADGLEYCAFMADGWKWYAYYDGATPIELMDALDQMPLNMPATITGDLVQYGDITTEVVLREVRLEPGTDPFSNIRGAIQGEWVATDDPGLTLSFYGGDLYERYNNAPQANYHIEIAESCEDSAGAGPVMIQTDVETRDTFCYLFDNYEGGFLDLIYMGHDAMLSFRKVE